MFPPAVRSLLFLSAEWALIASWAATVFSLAVYACGLFEFELWPLTCVPMYSFYRDPRTHKAAHIANEQQAQVQPQLGSCCCCSVVRFEEGLLCVCAG